MSFTYTVVKGDTLSALAKKYSTTVTELKKINKLTSDTIKIGQSLQIPLPNLKFPFVIAKSKNNLNREDSKSSKLEKLPTKFYTRNDELYKAGKEAIHKKLISLMEWGSAQVPHQTDYEIFTKDLANKFLTNTKYSLDNAYSHPLLTKTVAESLLFKRYKMKVTDLIRQKVKTNKIITQNQIILSVDEIKNMNFQEGDENYWKTGLIIAIDQVSYTEVVIKDITYKNGAIDYINTDFILYDTYGLDMPDIEKYGELGLDYSDFESKEKLFKTLDEIIKTQKERKFPKGIIAGIFGYYFNCWYALQRYYGCVPLLVKVKIENVGIKI